MEGDICVVSFLWYFVTSYSVRSPLNFGRYNSLHSDTKENGESNRAVQSLGEKRQHPRMINNATIY